MIYCRDCKILAKPGESNCSKCGRPFVAIGSTAASAGPATPDGPRPGAAGPRPAESQPAAFVGLVGQIEETEKAVRVNVVRSRVLAGLSLAIGLGILLVVYQVYARTVLDYARLSNVKIKSDPDDDRKIHFSYMAETTGKVVYGRQSGAHRVEMVQTLNSPGPMQRFMRWPASSKSGIQCHVRYRGYLLPAYANEHFKIQSKYDGVDAIFVVDSSKSMARDIEELRSSLPAFEQVFKDQGMSLRTGLVSFAGLQSEAEVQTSRLGPPIVTQKQLSLPELTLGSDGDGPALSALAKTFSDSYAKDYDTRRLICLILMTDSGCSDRGQLSDEVKFLRDRTPFIVNVIASGDQESVYRSLCVNSGRFYKLRESPPIVLLPSIAESLVEMINSR